MIFYGSNWGYIGDKAGLQSQLSLATGIPRPFIEDGDSIDEASVAARMSWASSRETTRPEDGAYCLMGIFDVNMPLLYGEGRKAFIRLQHEIAKNSEDESLFAWNTEGLQSGIFAPNALAFAGCEDIRSFWTPNIHRVTPKQASTITNRGLHLEALPRRLPISSLHGVASLPKEALKYDYFLLPLNCARTGSEDKPFTIIIRRISHNQFARFLPGECMVYEKYFSDNELEWDRPKERDFHHMIFIKDPPKLKVSSIWRHHLTVDRVKPRPLMWQRSSYRLVEWYVSPPGILMDFTLGAWSLRFLGWSGFAVLKFEDWKRQKRPFIIVFRNVHTETANRTVTMLIVTDGTATVFEAVNACYEQRDLLSVVPDVLAEQSVWNEAGEEINLERVADTELAANPLEPSLKYTDNLLSLPEDEDMSRTTWPETTSQFQGHISPVTKTGVK
ncbi:MAG: hypothetical protein Q9185_000623 [Variospora sp. 1 TL-2023]